MRYYYTYKVQCTAVGWEDYYYLGKHITSNLNDGYKGSGRKLKEYYNQYPDDYTFTILAFYKDKTELSIAEQKLIGDLWKTDPYCLNANAGGNGSWAAASKSCKGKVSALKGRTCSDEHKQKVSLSLKDHYGWNKGKHLSDEAKKRMSEAHKGKKLSEETKRKISDARKGIKFSDETKMRISESKKGKPRSEETKRKISESCKKKGQS